MIATRTLLAGAALVALHISGLHAQTTQDKSILPTLRAEVTVITEIVRIGDIVENAGAAAPIAIFRAPDPGTSGALPVATLLAALRTHEVIGIETRGLRDVTVTRAGRTVAASDIEALVAQTLAQRMAIADPSSLTITHDREVQSAQIDVAYSASPTPIAVRIDQRGRFDVLLEIAGDNGVAPVRLRYTGTAADTVETVVPLRAMERGETIKASDIIIERRPRADIGGEALARDRAIGMQARRQLRAGTPLRSADLAKPDLVQRDQSVTLIYESAGIYLTGRGKAMEAGTEGDVVSVMNLLSKRTMTGTVSGRGQVTISVPPARPSPANLSAAETTPSVAMAAATFPINRQAE